MLSKQYFKERKEIFMVNDMTKGTPWKLLIMFSIPLLIGNIFQQLYNMADTIIVGRTLGVQALAAVGATGCIAFLIIGFVQGITSGFAVITAQRFGAGDEKGVRRSAATSIILSIAVTIIMTALSVALSYPMLRAMNTPSDIIDGSHAYISVMFAGLIAPVFFNLFSSILRSLGDSKTPLVFLIIASVINIVLDFVFILSFKMGVAGAAWATVTAQMLSGVMCLVYSLKRFPILRLKREDWRFSWNFAWAHLRIGLPMAFQFSITAIGVMILQTALNSLGSTAVAAYTAASKIDQLATQPLVSYGVAMATYAAQNYGAGRPDRIKRGVTSCSIIAIVSGLLGCAVVILFRSQLVSLFVGSDKDQVMDMVSTYLWINAVPYFVLGLLFVFRNVLQGIGSSTMPLLAGVFELITRSVIAFTLTGVFGFKAICAAGPAAWAAAAIPLMITYAVMLRGKTFASIGSTFE